MEIHMNAILATTATILLTWLVIRRVYTYLHYSYPEGPQGLPLIGNMHNIDLKTLHLSLWDHREKYGDLSYFSYGGTNFVVLNTFDAIKEALTSNEYKVTFAGRVRNFFGTYCFPEAVGQATYSPKWAKLRKIAAKAIKLYANDRDKIEEAIVSELRLLKEDLSATNGKAFDIHPRISKSIGNIVYILLTGERFDYDHEIHELQVKFDKEIVQLLGMFNNTMLTMFPLIRHIPISCGKVYQTTMSRLEQIFKYIYYDIKNNKAFGNNTGFVHDILKIEQENDWFTERNSHDTTFDIHTGGITTTKATLYSLLLMLIHRNEIQKRIQQEISDIVGDDREPCLDDQPHMPYVQAVILETLRHFSLVPTSLPHLTMEDVTFRGYKLKKGTVVVLNVWRVHHDEELWEDPWTFNPDRFLNEDGELVPPEHPARSHMIIFSMGKRQCPGAVFAKTRLFLFVTHLCQKFDIYNDDMTNVASMDPRDFDETFVLSPQHYTIQLRRRDIS